MPAFDLPVFLLHRTAILALLTIVSALVAVSSLFGGEPFSATERLLWTKSNVHGTPDPPDPYRLEIAFPQLKFDEPLSITLIPGTNRFLLCGRDGKLFTFEDRPDA